MRSYLVTGTSRGIGLAIVEELLTDPRNFVVATARNLFEFKGLQDLKIIYSEDRLALITLDVIDEESIRNVVREVTTLLPNGLDYCISNAGSILQSSVNVTFEHCDIDLFEDEIRVNVLGPVRVIRAFLPLIRLGAGKTVALMSSNLGCLELAPMFDGLGDTYSTTKAALNMVARKWGSSLRKEGIAMILLHPGWVSTDLGETMGNWVHADRVAPHITKYSARESAVKCIEVISEARLEEKVLFIAVDGTHLPW